MALKKLIFFDVETNGLKGTSVLSISAMKASYNTETDEMLKLGEYDRFYFRNDGEQINEKAIIVNGLTDEEIEIRRSKSDIKYARTFEEDIQSFYDFCDGADHFIAHNIRFDRDFIPFKLECQFDTMLENMNILKIPGKYNSYKWPTLNECAEFYNVEVDENELHQSIYDVLTMARIFFKMRKNTLAKSRIKEYVIENKGTRF
ncbi:3'-5' exonuclease [Oceanivirga salmonicida]|uniref:3'-5' exonuclease n=1 Tax=Oceanivirga salmonicida TaxID=1769291 RepID=UPI0008378521|nr:3'-5' exonuclease [Oceanivirga salmonicida]